MDTMKTPLSALIIENERIEKTREDEKVKNKGVKKLFKIGKKKITCFLLFYQVNMSVLYTSMSNKIDF